MKLLDLALDEDFAANLEKSLGTLIGDGGEAAGEACREDDGIVHGVGLQRGHALGREAGALNESGFREVLDGGICGRKSDSALICEIPLRNARVLAQGI